MSCRTPAGARSGLRQVVPPATRSWWRRGRDRVRHPDARFNPVIADAWPAQADNESNIRWVRHRHWALETQRVPIVLPRVQRHSGNGSRLTAQPSGSRLRIQIWTARSCAVQPSHQVGASGPT